MYRGRRGEPDGDCAVNALPLSAFFLVITAYGVDRFVAAHFTPVFVAECAFGQAVLFFKSADSAVAARLSCHGEPPSRKIETC